MAQFTPQSIGSPGKNKILADILAHLTQAEHLWIGRCDDLLRWQEAH